MYIMFITGIKIIQKRKNHFIFNKLCSPFPVQLYSQGHSRWWQRLGGQQRRPAADSAPRTPQTNDRHHLPENIPNNAKFKNIKTK